MKKSSLMWIAALILTVLAAYYQRVTGPTYPISGKITLNSKEITYQLKRSHGGNSDSEVQIKGVNAEISGVLEWRRYRTMDQWTGVEMTQNNGILSGMLPHQPPAGKLEYRVTLRSKDQLVTIPAGDPVIIRFKREEPLVILIPHIIAMFGAMLLSTRTGMESLSKEPRLRKLTFWTLSLLVLGGLILGPLMQHYAFGPFWTGLPFGTDLTDNKTLIALIGWVVATISLYKSKKPQVWVLLAAILLLVVYLIPHSILGSELNYSTMRQ
jgi:hypothetical protein